MPAPSSLNLTSLDFDTLKQNLITFLKAQTQFKDYAFEGSNMNVLLDILSYNTYLNAFYLNMAASEAFMDTAQLRPSVVSIAKELNYVPQSTRSAVATVNLSFNTTGLNGNLVIPTGTIFVGRNSNDTFTFVTDQTHSLLSAGSQFNVSNVNVYEGKLFTETFIVDNTIENQKFILSNQKVDDNSITVTVSSDGGQNVNSYVKKTTLYGLKANSYIFFVQEDRGQIYEIYFGDGVFGAVPPNGAAITTTYRVTNGSRGNGVANVMLSTDLGPINSGVVKANTVMVTGSQNGADIEGIESVRFRAPLHYQTQERAVTALDYKDIIIENYPEVEDISVFGGEDISGSVQYGTVFVALTTTSGSPLPDNIKTDIKAFLEDKKNLAVKTTLIDPDYLFIVPQVTTYVDFSNTASAPSDIVSNIQRTIINWNDNNLKSFNDTFILSKFSAAVDDSDTAIKGSSTSLTMYKNVLFANGTPQTVTIPFGNPITPGSISSSSFVLSDGKFYQITDFNPNLNTFKGTQTNGSFNVVNSSNTIYFKQVTTNNVQNFVQGGVVNYANGSIFIQSIDVFQFANPQGIQVTVTPATTQITGKNQMVLEVDTDTTKVNVVAA
jgi:hypothetical protein